MKRFLACSGLAALALSACGSGDEAVSIDGAWARTSAEGQTTGAVYFLVTADADDRLLAVSVPASVAAAAQIHEAVMADTSDTDMPDEDMADMGEGDVGVMDSQMTMQELVDGLALPAGQRVVLEPGGYHVMLLDLVEPLAVGDEIELTLDFEHADDTVLTVEVAESAP